MRARFYANPAFIRWLHDVLFAIYGSFLFVWIEESRAYAWSTQGRYLYFWHPHAVSLHRSDFVLFYSELFLLPAVAIFLFLLSFKRLPGAQRLRAIGGIIAVAGFPLVCAYRERPLLFLEIELAFSVLYLLFWIYRKFPASDASAGLNIVLLIFHYGLWFFFGGAPYLLGWRWGTGGWDYSWFVYALLGFAYATVWAIYFRTPITATRREASIDTRNS